MAELTRGEFARKLAEFMELDLSATGGFSDTSGLYIDGHVTALKALGVTTGIGGGKFGTDRPITRAEAVTMLGRAFAVAPSTSAGFTDVPSTSYYAGFANAFKELGVFLGHTDGTFAGSQVFDSTHFDLVLSRLSTAGFGAVGDVGGGTGAGDPGPTVDSPLPDGPGETPDVTTPDEAPPAISEDYLQASMNMLEESFGIPATAELRAFVTKAWDEGWTESEVETFMYMETWFTDRFPALAERREKGLAPISPQDYIELESGYAEQMRRAGFPPGFYDSPEDFHQWIADDRSVIEIRDDIAEPFQRINEGPIEVRDYFAAIYGPSGDAALAAFMIDPDKSQALLEEAADVSEIGGTASRFGFDLSSDRALRLSSIGVDIDAADNGFAQLSALSPIFEETVGEANQGEDLDALDQGLDAIFNMGGQGAREIEKRRRQRLAAFQGGSSAAADTSGVFGLGTAS